MPRGQQSEYRGRPNAYFAQLVAEEQLARRDRDPEHERRNRETADRLAAQLRELERPNKEQRP